MDGAEIGLIEIGGALKHRSALFHRRLPGPRGADRRLHLIGRRRVHLAHLIGRIRRVRYRFGRAIGQIGGQCGARGEEALAIGRAGLFDLIKRLGVGEIPPARILPLRLEEIGRQADRGGARRRGLECCEGIGGDGFGRHVFIDDLIDEGAVGAIFQQAAHQIGQEIAVLAHRRIDAAARALARHDDIMQPLAHAVQALKFVILAPKPRLARHVEDRLHRMGVMGGELGIDAIRHPQKPARIGYIGNIRGRLAGKHRKSRRADHLGALDLAVPVGTLDEPHHDAPLKPSGERVEPFDHRARALAIGLHHHAESIPSRKRGIGEHRLDHIERKIEAVGLLGIDVEAHAGRARKRGERKHARHKLGHHARALGFLVARMQRRELHRNAGIEADVAPRAGSRDRGDRAPVGEVIGIRILHGARRLAEHVVGIAVAPFLHRAGALHRRADALAKHELAPHLLHRARHRRADHRLAKPLQSALQMRGDAGLLGLFQHPARQHQRPGGGIDERRGGMAEVARPVRRGDLVLDQGIDGFAVGHAQECFGKAHQRDALLGGKAVFGEEHLHQPRARGGADLAHQIGRPGADGGAGIGRERGRVLKIGEHGLFICILKRADTAAQCLGRAFLHHCFPSLQQGKNIIANIGVFPVFSTSAAISPFMRMNCSD